MQNTTVAVVGAGSWATAIVKILLNNRDQVNWWIREPGIIDHLKRYGHNPEYLSSVWFDRDKLYLSDDINQILERSDIIIFCIPAAFLHESLLSMKAELLKGRIIVSGIKGVVPQYDAVVAEYFRQVYGINRMVVVSGPSHAEEVAQERLTYLTVAAEDTAVAAVVAELLQCRYIKTVVSRDIAGIEYAPVLKNIYAIASGLCNGLGYGDNFQAVLISNAVQEMDRFISALHPAGRDINSSVYLGDLLVTCYSQYSRNRMFGTMIGKGYSVKFAQFEMKMVAEGYYATKSIYNMGLALGLEMPVVETVYSVLYQNQIPATAVRLLAEKLR